MAKTGIGILDQGFEALEEGTKQAVKGVGQQVSVTAKVAATQVTGSNFSGKPNEPAAAVPTDASSQPSADVQTLAADAQAASTSDADKQDMLKALYGPTVTQQPGESTQSPAQIQNQAKASDESELVKTRQKIEQEAQQKHQQQHNEVYFDKLNKPETKPGQKEESVQEKLDREKAEEDQKKQKELEEKEKKETKVKAPSKNSAEHERKLGG